MDERFACDNGQCMKAYKKCNGHDDCPDGEDESKQTCGANCDKVDGRFACNNATYPWTWKCISDERKCDGRSDCFGGSDEDTNTCGDNCGGINFKCANGKCIPGGLKVKCNGYPNCSDGSDESTYACGTNCEKMQVWENGSFTGGFACDNGECIRGSLKCSHGIAWCADGSDCG